MDQPAINALSLCSGGAGLDIGASLVLEGMRTRCYVEREGFAVGYLLEAMEQGWLDPAPVWTNLKTFDGKPWHRRIHLVLGGYPCQPFSFAGQRAGRDDPRHLWPDIRRILGEIEPPLCFFENVSGHLSLGFDEVARDLEGMGYEVAVGLWTAAEVGACHKRERLFILAYSASHDGGDGGQRSPTRQDSLGGGIGAGKGGVQVGDNGRTLAYAERAERWPGNESGCRGEQGSNREGQGSSSSGVDGNPLANTSSERREVRTRERDDAEQERSAAERDRGGVVYATGNGRGEGRAEHGMGSGRDSAPVAGLPIFPPGPGELDRWRAILAEDDSLAPALSKVRLLAHGMAHDRARWLRLFGNGVVPLQAATAFCSLWAALRFTQEEKTQLTMF